MAHNSRSIVSEIKNLPDSFTRGALRERLIRGSLKTRKDGRIRHRGGSPRDHRSIETLIDNTLLSMVSAGLLRKDRKGYRKLSPFKGEGVLVFSKRTSGSIQLANCLEVKIPRDGIASAHDGDTVSFEIVDCIEGEVFGDVTDVRDRSKQFYTARVARRDRGIILFDLLDTPAPMTVASSRKSGDPELHSRVVVSLEEHRSVGGFPAARVIREFDEDDESFDLTRVKIKHTLPADHSDYAELGRFVGVKNPVDRAPRKDYAGLFTVTIDGADAKDFDDAISVEYKKGIYYLYVHIADVSAYVAKDGELDREARSRGTSFYLGRDVIPMLPEKLSNDLCSLVQGKKRLTMTAEMQFDARGMLLGCNFFRGIIKSDRRLTYDQAQDIIEKPGKSRLDRNVALMQKLASLLYERRIEGGSLDLELPEEKLVFDKDGKIRDIRFAARLSSNRLIEEFMLCANIVVSRTLREQQVPTLYRIHEDISEESMDKLKQFLRVFNIRTPDRKEEHTFIQQVISGASGRPYEAVVNLVVLRSLMQAYYGIEPVGHFGLAFDDYTHFTSPIRRYPDLVVHRCLKGYIDGKRSVYSEEELIPIGEKSSEMERIAQRAERDLVKIKTCRLMKDRVGETFTALVSGIAKSGFFVTCDEMPLEGMVSLRSLGDDYYVVEEDRYRITGRSNGRRFTLGDAVVVRLSGVDIDRMMIDFEIVKGKR